MDLAGRVRLLDEATVRLIAAGEVVERPASVVKELVENALDAGARRVEVDLEGGGVHAIEVVDDGCGMAPEDARLAVERHATSKIASASDLEAVATLGFRGEALPSIAAVSRLEIVTREPGSLAGTRLVVRGGRVEACEEVGCAAGTRVSVRELFFNTPARRKHLKTAAVELERCVRAVMALALARPEVGFRVRHQGRQLLATPGTGHLADALAAVWGRDLAEALLPVAAEEAGLRLRGYVAPPAAARSSRAQQHFSVNGRPVGAFPLSQALEDAFAGLVMGGRHPVACLQLELDPRAVDVNVHPAKLRVRFRDEGAVARLVRQAVRAALAGTDLAAPARLTAAAPGGGAAASEAAAARACPLWEDGAAVSPVLPGEVGEAAVPYRLAPQGAGCEEAGAAGGRPWGNLRLIGQLGQTYVLAEGADGLYIIDQHAAHERLNFERHRRLRAAGAPPGQPLAASLPVHVGPGLVAVWEAERERVGRLGFRAEPFGSDTLLLREAPALFTFTAEAAERAFRDLLDWLAEGPGREWRDEEALARLASRSCRQSVRAGDPLSPAEMDRLLRDLAGAENPFTCPHGRPTVVRVTRRQLERLFGRA